MCSATRLLFALLALGCALAVAQTRRVPEAFRPAASSRSAPDRLARRSRPVTIDFSLFDRNAAAEFRARRNTAPVRRATRLNLFDDTAFDVVWDRAAQTDDGGTVWSGSIPGIPLSEAVIAVNGSTAFGTVHAGGGKLYRIQQSPGGGHEIAEIDTSLYPPEALPQAVPPSAADEPAVYDGDATIDVMVVYTAAARQRAGGEPQIAARIQNAIEATNRGYANSGIFQRVRLVYSGELDFAETGSFENDLAALRDPADGKGDAVHALRDQYAADVVSLWVAENGYCGYGYLMKSPSVAFASSAFSLVNVDCATDVYSFGHEMGHNMGAQHDRADADSPGAFPYSYGYRQAEAYPYFRTVMAYKCYLLDCPRINYWSNPGVAFQGIATGTDQNSPRAADNHATLNNTRAVVAGFRQGVSAAPASGILPDLVIDSFTSGVEAAPGGTVAGGVRAVVRNQGPSEAGAFRIAFYLGSTANVTPASIFTGWSCSVPSLEAGATFNCTGDLGIPATVAPGTYFLAVIADDRNDVAEISETNNVRTSDSGPLSLAPAAGSDLPDLLIDGLAAGTSAVPGGPLQAYIAIRNQGTAATGPFRLGYYLGKTVQVSAADLFTGSSCTFPNGLAAGAVATCSNDLQIPAGTPPGTYFVTAVIDDLNEVTESDETNNARAAGTGPVAVSAANAILTDPRRRRLERPFQFFSPGWPE